MNQDDQGQATTPNNDNGLDDNNPDLTVTNCAVRHLDHVGIAVSNVEAAVAVFQKLLDAPKTPIIEAPELGLRVAIIEQGETRLELLESTNPTNAIGKHLEKRGEGLHHIAFCVDNIQAKLDELKKDNVPLIDQDPRLGLTGIVAFLQPQTTHRVLVELVQPVSS